MELVYKSTRDTANTATASAAILNGLADDGGLYVPSYIPEFGNSLEDFANMSYQEIAFAIMRLYFTDFTEEELKSCIHSAYSSRFDTPQIAPLVEHHGAFYLELFHGPTIAFKDMALSILPYLMTSSARKNHVENDIVILTATSGDTGKAALAGFAGVPGTKIIVFYPKDGVSPIQKKQMVTQREDNTFVVGIDGNFDQAQGNVKAIFHDRELSARMEAAGYQFSSANSINIGRLVPQIVYYVHAYATLMKQGKIPCGEAVNIVVPTGNFGNILAAYYAKHMGLPVHKLICASNENKVLFDFFATGEYDRNRNFHVTSSPSMDILVSSNLERLIYLISGEDAGTTASLMEQLSGQGRYQISPDMREKLKDFYGNYATQQETAQLIMKVHEQDSYVLDPHTAVAAAVYEKYKEDTKDDTKTIIASTASPYKFTRSVMEAIEGKCGNESDFDLADRLCALSHVPIPAAIEEIRNAPVIHTHQCAADQMRRSVEQFLGLSNA